MRSLEEQKGRTSPQVATGFLDMCDESTRLFLLRENMACNQSFTPKITGLVGSKKRNVYRISLLLIVRAAAFTIFRYT